MGENRAQAGALKPPFSGFNQSLSWCKVNSKPKQHCRGVETQTAGDPRPALCWLGHHSYMPTKAKPSTPQPAERSGATPLTQIMRAQQRLLQTYLHRSHKLIRTMSRYTCPSANSSFHLGKHLCCGDSFCQKSLNLSAPRDSMSAHSLRSPATCDNRKASRFLEQNKAQDCSTAANGRFSESCFADAPTTPRLSHIWRIASQPT